MKYMFQESGIKLLRSLSLAKTLLAFDFDGTLAPIVEQPELARMSSSVNNSFLSLAKNQPVAVISGRSINDLRKRVPSGISLVGNHGLEGLSKSKKSAEMVLASVEGWKKRIRENWKKVANDPGVFLEDKEYSLALHYRNSKAKKEAKRRIFDLISDLDPHPRIIMGKSVFNLLPIGAPHKGVAILELMSQGLFSAALYVGDDDTDEDVFALPDQRIVTIRVGYKRSSQAQFFLKRQSEIKRLIEYFHKN